MKILITNLDHFEFTESDRDRLLGRIVETTDNADGGNHYPVRDGSNTDWLIKSEFIILSEYFQDVDNPTPHEMETLRMIYPNLEIKEL